MSHPFCYYYHIFLISRHLIIIIIINLITVSIHSELNKIDCVKIVSRLLKEPVDLNLRNKDGKTAYELALEKKCHDIFRMFTHR